MLRRKKRRAKQLKKLIEGFMGFINQVQSFIFLIKRMGYCWLIIVEDYMKYAKCQEHQFHANFIHQTLY